MITTTLAYFPSPAQGVWYLGPVPLRAYALCIIVGIIVALVIGDRRWIARGGEPGVIYDIAMWAVPFGLIGGRLYHVMTDWKTYFGPGGAGPLAALRIWDGGLGIWGAVALGGVGAWIACRRRGIPLPAFGDAVAPGIVLAQAIGRVGNYFNQELYGRETTVPWGMEVFYRRDAAGMVDVHSLNGVSTGQVAAVVHPTFLYELLWNVLVFVALIIIDRRFKIGHGRLFALYVAGYCIGRFGVELLRDDFATHIAGIRINSFTATFVFIGAVVYFILAPKGREAPATLAGNGRESLAEELVDELEAAAVGVAASSPIGAAVTVADRDEAEDAALTEPPEDTEVLAIADAEGEPTAVEADDEADDAGDETSADNADSDAAEPGDTTDDPEAVLADADSTADADESVDDEPVEAEDVVAVENEAAEDEAAEVDAAEEPVDVPAVTEESAVSEPDADEVEVEVEDSLTETVATDEVGEEADEAEAVVAEAVEAEADVTEASATDAVEAEADIAEASATDTAESEADATEATATEATATEATETEAVDIESDVAETDVTETDVAKTDATDVEPAADEPDQEQPKRRFWRRRG